MEANLGPNRSPRDVKLTGVRLEGTFESAGKQFAFTAAVDGDTLHLATGGATHVLMREDAAANPLGAEAQDPKGINSERLKLITSQLATLRTEIQLFKLQHNEVPS